MIHMITAVKAEEVKLLLFQKGEDIPCKVIPFPKEERMGDVWSMTLSSQGLEELYYCFEADGKAYPDLYGKSFVGKEDWGNLDNYQTVLKSPVRIESFDWERDTAPGHRFEDSILYRVHTRGLTRHPSSKVKARGTFLGIVEKIPYFKELGVTTIELMPPMEFDEVMMPQQIEGNPYGDDKPTGKINYWGYGPALYFAPKASYCYGKEKNPSVEFKTLVKELHRNGLELIIEAYFTGKESPILVLEMARFWVKEYHVDGIHLVGCVDLGLLASDPYLSKTKLLSASVPQQYGREGSKYIAEAGEGFLVDIRKFLKGDEDQINNLIFRTKRNPAQMGVINFLATTNGFTMMDMVSYDRKHNEANGENNQDGADYNYSWNCGVEGATRKKKILELRKKQLRNGFLLLFLSQGTPMILSGDEFGNSQDGNNNAYCQDNEISWLNWNLLKTNQDIVAFVSYMIGFRKRHPVFHMAREPRNMDYLSCGQPDVSYHGVNTWCPEFENFRRQLGILYCGAYGVREDGTKDNYFYVAYNMHWEPHEFALPNLPKTMKWHVAINTDDGSRNGIYEEGKEALLEDQKHFKIADRSIVVFVGK